MDQTGAMSKQIVGHLLNEQVRRDQRSYAGEHEVMKQQYTQQVAKQKQVQELAKEQRADVRKRKFAKFEQRLGDTPEKKAKAKLDYEHTEKKLENLDSIMQLRGQLTQGEQARMDASVQKDVRKSIMMLGDDFDKPEFAGDIEIINRYGNESYYLSSPIEDAPGIQKWGIDVPGAKMPLPSFQGKQLTMKDVRETAEANGMQIEDVLVRMNMLTKVGENDYRPR